MDQVLATWLIGAGAFLVLLWAIRGPVKFLYNLTIKAHDVIELLYGDDKDGRLGLDKRLEAFEAEQTSQSTTLNGQSQTLLELRHELKPNGGSSMNDRLTRVEKHLDPDAPDNH